MSTYSFPVLQNHEIIMSLSDMNLTITEEGLNKPTYELCRPLYESLVQLMVGVTREEMQQPVFSAIDAIEFPELHDESIPAMAFIRNLFKLMRACGVQDFNLRVRKHTLSTHPLPPPPSLLLPLTIHTHICICIL